MSEAPALGEASIERRRVRRRTPRQTRRPSFGLSPSHLAVVAAVVAVGVSIWSLVLSQQVGAVVDQTHQDASYLLRQIQTDQASRAQLADRLERDARTDVERRLPPEGTARPDVDPRLLARPSPGGLPDVSGATAAVEKPLSTQTLRAYGTLSRLPAREGVDPKLLTLPKNNIPIPGAARTDRPDGYAVTKW